PDPTPRWSTHHTLPIRQTYTRSHLKVKGTGSQGTLTLNSFSTKRILRMLAASTDFQGSTYLSKIFQQVPGKSAPSCSFSSSKRVSHFSLSSFLWTAQALARGVSAPC